MAIVDWMQAVAALEPGSADWPGSLPRTLHAPLRDELLRQLAARLVGLPGESAPPVNAATLCADTVRLVYRELLRRDGFAPLARAPRPELAAPVLEAVLETGRQQLAPAQRSWLRACLPDRRLHLLCGAAGRPEAWLPPLLARVRELRHWGPSSPMLCWVPVALLDGHDDLSPAGIEAWLARQPFAAQARQLAAAPVADSWPLTRSEAARRA